MPATARAYSKNSKLAARRRRRAEEGALALPKLRLINPSRVAEAEAAVEAQDAERAKRHPSAHMLVRLGRKDRRALNERQVDAGMRYHELVRASQSTVVSSLEERGPRSHDPFPVGRLERCVHALELLRAAQAVVWQPLRDAVLDPIAVDCRSPEDVAKERGRAQGRVVSPGMVLEMLRLCLDELAGHFERETA